VKAVALIGVVIDEMFEDVEYTKPALAFKEAGHSLTHIGLREGQLVKGKRKKTPVKIDQNIKDAKIDPLDAILIPGGCSPDHLRGYKEAVKFIKAFFETGKPIFAICHAPQLLITAQLLEGRRVTGWRSIVQDIKNAGAIYVDQEVVEDDNLISSRGPHDIPAFTKTALKKLESL
jgi:protease I